jgi:hypothetical protein
LNKIISKFFLHNVDNIKNSIKSNNIKIFVVRISRMWILTESVSKIKNNIVIDTRNILNSKIVSKSGIIYTGIVHV